MRYKYDMICQQSFRIHGTDSQHQNSQYSYQFKNENGGNRIHTNPKSRNYYRKSTEKKMWALERCGMWCEMRANSFQSFELPLFLLVRQELFSFTFIFLLTIKRHICNGYSIGQGQTSVLNVGYCYTAFRWSLIYSMRFWRTQIHKLPDSAVRLL